MRDVRSRPNWRDAILLRRRYVMRLRRPRFRGLRTPVATPGQSARRLLLVGLLAAILAIAAWAGTTQTYVGQRIADLILYGRFGADPAVSGAAASILDMTGLASAAVIALAIFILAFVRGGLGMAAAVALTLGGANATAQVLKDLLYRPNLIGNATYASGNSFPSGTVTLVASLGFVLILVAPRRVRTLSAIGAIVLTAAVGVSTITAGWHRLADVVGADLIALGWAALVTAALVLAQGRMPRRTWTRGLGRRTTFITGATGVIVICAGAVILAIALVDPAPLGRLIDDRSTTPEAFVASIAIAIGTALIGTGAYVWAMRGVAVDLPG